MNSVCKALTASLVIFLSGCFYPSSEGEDNTTPRQTTPAHEVEKVQPVKAFDHVGEVKSLLAVKNDSDYSNLSDDQVIRKAFLEGRLPFSDKLISRTLPRATSSTTDYEIQVVEKDGVEYEVAVKKLSNLNFEVGNLIISDITYRLVNLVDNTQNATEFDATYMDKIDQVEKNGSFRFDSTNVLTKYMVNKENPLGSSAQVAQNISCPTESESGAQACVELAKLIQTPRNLINSITSKVCILDSDAEKDQFSFDISTIKDNVKYSPEYAVTVARKTRKTVYFNVNQSLNTINLANGDTVTFFVDLAMFNYNAVTNSYKNSVVKGYYTLGSSPDKKQETLIYCNKDTYEY